MDWSPFWLSLQVAVVATLIALPLGVLAAWRLAVGRPFWGKTLLETVLVLPLVLPPTVVGFVLLMLFGHGSSVGRWLNDTLGIHLIFTWQGAAIASCAMALPLMIRTAAAAFASVEVELLEIGRTLGASELTLLFQALIPLSYRGLLAGTALTFARALGEFGATLMVAGSIPGRTQTLPLALYTSVQGGRMREAWLYTFLLALMAFVVLGAVNAYQNRIGTLRAEK